jgi:hypothetical protein
VAAVNMVNMDTPIPNGGPRTPGWMAGAAGGVTRKLTKAIKPFLGFYRMNAS